MKDRRISSPLSRFLLSPFSISISFPIIVHLVIQESENIRERDDEAPMDE